MFATSPDLAALYRLADAIRDLNLFETGLLLMAALATTLLGWGAKVASVWTAKRTIGRAWAWLNEPLPIIEPAPPRVPFGLLASLLTAIEGNATWEPKERLLLAGELALTIDKDGNIKTAKLGKFDPRDQLDDWEKQQLENRAANAIHYIEKAEMTSLLEGVPIRTESRRGNACG